MLKLKSFAAGLCLGIAAIGIAAGSAHPAQATIMAADLPEVSGLDTFITRDTVSGLDWLDVNLTTSISFNDITGGGLITNGGALMGLNPITGFVNPFRHATQSEINQLFVNAFIPNINAGFTDANFAPVNALKALLGPTSSLGTPAEAVLGVSAEIFSPGFLQVGLLQECSATGPLCTGTLDPAGPSFTGKALSFGAISAETFGTATRGHFLTRASPAVAVPEPPTWALMVVGLTALAWVLRRRRTL